MCKEKRLEKLYKKDWERKVKKYNTKKKRTKKNYSKWVMPSHVKGND